jgi:CPA1 family monovalent cation:H+ antiporter
VAAEIFMIGAVLVTAVLAGRWLAVRFGVPDAAAYVVLGALVALVPGMSEIQLSPDVVLLLFLPPLIYYAGFFSDPRETVEHLPAVIGQSVGLVLATAILTAGRSWPRWAATRSVRCWRRSPSFWWRPSPSASAG